MIETSEVAPKGTLQAYAKAKAENERLRDVLRQVAEYAEMYPGSVTAALAREALDEEAS